jgi:hypothetical protein
MKQLRVGIYARVSTDDRGQDPLNQLLQLRAFAQEQGWAIVREYTDEMTAKNSKRPGFQAMWKDAEAHRFDCLLFWSLDRLTREGTFATLQYLRRLSDLGTKFKTTQSNTSILSAFSEKRSSAFLRPWRSRSGLGLASAPKQALRACEAMARSWDGHGCKTCPAHREQRCGVTRKQQHPRDGHHCGGRQQKPHESVVVS